MPLFVTSRSQRRALYADNQLRKTIIPTLNLSNRTWSIYNKFLVYILRLWSIMQFITLLNVYLHTVTLVTKKKFK